MKSVICLAAALMLAPAAMAQWAAPGKTTAAQPAPTADQAPQSAQPAGSQASSAKMPSFAAIDTDNSKSLSLAELQAQDATITQAQFDKYDANHDGKLSQSEFSKMSKDMMASNSAMPASKKKPG